MAGTLTRGYTFGATEEVTAAKLHALVDSGSVSGITADEIASGTITNDKIASVSGEKFTNLSSIPLGAGIIPKENLTSVAQKGANSDITSLSGLTTALSTAQGGTGSTANANAASGVVVLNASSQLPAVSGALLTNLPVTKATLGVDSGAVSVGANTYATVSFNFTFSLAPIIVVTPTAGDTGVGEDYWVTNVGTTTFRLYSSCDATRTINWIAVGTPA